MTMTAAERQQLARDRRKAGLVRLDVFVTQEVKDAMVELMIEMQDTLTGGSSQS